MRPRSIAAVVIAAGLFAGCHHKPAETTKAEATPAATPAVANAGDEAARTGLPAPKETVTLATVYFDFDKATLRDDAKAALAKNADALKDNPEVTVRLEGNADERGSTQYNLALGDRRANAVKDYLTSLGIAGNRLETVSYGMERPVDKGHDEAAWAKNRRVELVVTAGAGNVSSSYSTKTTE